MDERLKELMKELGYAINESIDDSDRISAAISEIKREGYDVFLVLEATIGYRKHGDEEDPQEVNLANPITTPSEESVRWTPRDEDFLRKMKIGLDGENDETLPPTE